LNVTTHQALRLARVLWIVSIVLFAAGVVAFLLGPKLEMIFMPSPLRVRDDVIVLRSLWAGRAIVLLLLSAITGIVGVVYSVKAAGREP
jgi:hypothetical protein